MKRLLYILMIMVFFSCKQEEVYTYLGTDLVQFNEKFSEFYSFVYAGANVKRDTVWINAHISGDIYPHKRFFKLRQTEEYSFQWTYDDSGALVDSVLVKVPNQAIPGVHYVSFDDPGYQELCYLENDSVTFKVPVIVLRDETLLKNDRRLKFEFIESDDFKVGDPLTKGGVLQITDRVKFPEAWNGYDTRPNVGQTSWIFGRYGQVKHRFMIEVSGKPWDNEFFDSLSKEEMFLYKNKFARALAELNAMRAEEGLPPLRENPDDERTNVVF